MTIKVVKKDQTKITCACKEGYVVIKNGELVQGKSCSEMIIEGDNFKFRKRTITCSNCGEVLNIF